MTASLSELDTVLPHMRAVAASLTGSRKMSAERAVTEAEAVYRQLRELDTRAEAAKTLFRCATTLGMSEDPTPTTLPATPNGPALPLGSSGAALVQRQV